VSISSNPNTPGLPSFNIDGCVKENEVKRDKLPFEEKYDV
jgi:hypothetical protein